MDAIGPTFKLLVAGDPVDRWTDSRLDSGAPGFYNYGRQAKLFELGSLMINKAVIRTALVPFP